MAKAVIQKKKKGEQSKDIMNREALKKESAERGLTTKAEKRAFDVGTVGRVKLKPGQDLQELLGRVSRGDIKRDPTKERRQGRLLRKLGAGRISRLVKERQAEFSRGVERAKARAAELSRKAQSRTGIPLADFAIDMAEKATGRELGPPRKRMVIKPSFAPPPDPTATAKTIAEQRPETAGITPDIAQDIAKQPVPTYTPPPSPTIQKKSTGIPLADFAINMANRVRAAKPTSTRTNRRSTRPTRRFGGRTTSTRRTNRRF